MVGKPRLWRCLLAWLTSSVSLPSLKEPEARLEALQEVCSCLPQENFSNLR